MKNITQKEINTAIKECKWRKELYSVDVCLGECLPCVSIIEKGKCDTLRELFKTKVESKESEE